MHNVQTLYFSSDFVWWCAFCAVHKEDLMLDWKSDLQGKEPLTIEPLR